MKNNISEEKREKMKEYQKNYIEKKEASIIDITIRFTKKIIIFI